MFTENHSSLKINLRVTNDELYMKLSLIEALDCTEIFLEFIPNFDIYNV